MTENFPSGRTENTENNAMSQIEYRFSLKLRVDSPNQLWNAAAARCRTLPGICEDDVSDMIGPVDDPSIMDCLMVLALPDQVPGCTRLDADLCSDVPPWQAPRH
ncbi:hypothetical protein [uncultured Novosphingobium sp.]|uniref:hypothetical protein n=1 Tax=Novosphingobium clariflavum TaxID=2029884 RepID=UPI002593D6DF|nr:hypothetical protein [uncultured Novosphingobium sp.]